MTSSSHLFSGFKRYFRQGRHVSLRSRSKDCIQPAHSASAGGTRDIDSASIVTDDCIYEEAATMVKSNKFDYTKKKNTGVSLGQFIAKQLDGEAEAVKRAAERAARKSVGSTEGDADTSVTHHIDLKIPGKQLGDDGLDVLCAGLEAAFAKGTADASLALEDVDLTDNKITTAGLARFASVIHKSNLDIMTIVLAKNAIIVETDQQALEWEMFLRSFATCQKLRRLDLSSNPGLGGRAMEVFAMIYIREPQIDPIRAIGEGDVQSLHSTGDSRSRSGSLALEVNGEAGRPRHTITDGRLLTRRCGLRSIPFISLKACGLTDAGALWLSYVIEDHYFPVQLVSELNAAVADSSIEAYRQDSKVHGIDWLGNEASLSKDGLSLLMKTESCRKQTVLDDRSSLAGSVLAETPSSATSQGNTSSLKERRPSHAVPGNRRVSLRSTTATGDDEQGLTELDSWRKRIQRQIIAHDEAKSADLWHAALQLLRVARCLLMGAPTGRSLCTESKTIAFSTEAFQSPPIIGVPNPAASIKTLRNGAQLSIEAVKSLPNMDRSYACTLGSPEIALTEVSNTPTTPKRVFKAHRKDAFSHSLDATTMTEKLSGLAICIPSSAEYLQYQENRMTEQGEHAFRDMSNVCHLPKVLINHVLGLALSDRKLALMNGAQKEAVVGWGMRRETLATGLQGKDLSFRAWRLLDNIGCVEYASE